MTERRDALLDLPGRKRFLAPILLLALLATAGCVTSSSSKLGPTVTPEATAASALPHQIRASWENRVVQTPDTVNQGKPLYGVAGRLYFFGEEIGQPLTAEGSLVIDLHEMKADGKHLMLERWEIDPETLKRLGRKDVIGWGYTLFLPWSTHRPDIQRVQLQVKYVPTKGVPLFSPPYAVSLWQEQPPITISSKVVPLAQAK